METLKIQPVIDDDPWRPAHVLLADPPWQFGDKLPGLSRGAEKNYATLSVDALCGYPLPPLADDALLFLWRVSAMQREALDVMEAWGFTLKSEIVWLKTTSKGRPWFGMGRYVRASHETCLIGARGAALGLIQHHSQRSTFSAPAGRHSAKPLVFYDIIEALAPGPYVELFARTRRPGWQQTGDELPPLLVALGEPRPASPPAPAPVTLTPREQRVAALAAALAELAS